MVCPNCGKEIEEGMLCICSDKVTNEMLVKQYRERVYDSRMKKEKENLRYNKSVQPWKRLILWLNRDKD